MLKKNWKGNREMLKNIQLLLITLLLAAFSLPAFAQPAGFPVPPVSKDQLFYLQRTPNTNTIIVDLNLKDGKPDEDEPVHVYWIRYTEKSQKAELNFIQRKFAYGVKSTKLKDGNFEIYFVSYKKFKMWIMPGAGGQYHAYGYINSKLAIMQKIYIHINGGTFWSPNVEYVDVTGTDPATGQTVKERRKV